MMSWVRAGQVLSIQSSLSCTKLILYILLCHLPQQLLQVLARCASCHSLIVFKGMIKPGRQRVLFKPHSHDGVNDVTALLDCYVNLCCFCLAEGLHLERVVLGNEQQNNNTPTA